MLTEIGRDFRPVLWALLAWGNKHFMPNGQRVDLVDSATGRTAEPMMIDRNSGKRLDQTVLRPVPRPNPGNATRRPS